MKIGTKSYLQRLQRFQRPSFHSPSRTRSALLKQKRFGRKISLPSTMEIRRDLVSMAHADTIVAALKGRGATKEEFAILILDLIDNKLLTQRRAHVLIDRYERTGPKTAVTE